MKKFDVHHVVTLANDTQCPQVTRIEAEHFSVYGRALVFSINRQHVAAFNRWDRVEEVQ